jgi:hypothetical protein
MTKPKEPEKTEKQIWDEYFAERDAERNASHARSQARLADAQKEAEREYRRAMAQINKPRKSRAQREAEIEEEFDRKHNPQKFKKEEKEPEAPTSLAEREQRKIPAGFTGIPAAPKEKSKAKEAVAEVLPAALNPIELAQRVRDLALPQNRHKLKEGVKTTLGSLATAGNEALYNIPSKIKPVGKYLKKFQEENPDAAKVGGDAGTFANVIPGDVAIKAASKIKKIKSFFNKGGLIKKGTAHDAAYGTIGGIGETLSPRNESNKKLSDVIVNAATSGIYGALLGGGYRRRDKRSENSANA